MTKNFTIEDFLTDNTYSYKLENLSIEVMAPPNVTNGSGQFTSVSLATLQVYGFMQQDSTLQRIPMTTWRNLSTTHPNVYSFNRAYINKHIYAGGFVPITNVNNDNMFGVHAVWTSGSKNADSSLEMKMDVRVRAIFSLNQDLQIGAITSEALGNTPNFATPVKTLGHIGSASVQRDVEQSDKQDYDCIPEFSRRSGGHVQRGFAR
jgi:hypothetical protein